MLLHLLLLLLVLLVLVLQALACSGHEHLLVWSSLQQLMGQGLLRVPAAAEAAAAGQLQGLLLPAAAAVGLDLCHSRHLFLPAAAAAAVCRPLPSFATAAAALSALLRDGGCCALPQRVR
jgi:hypothetical protein